MEHTTLDSLEISVISDMVKDSRFRKDDILRFINNEEVEMVGVEIPSTYTPRSVYSTMVLHNKSEEEVLDDMRNLINEKDL